MGKIMWKNAEGYINSGDDFYEAQDYQRAVLEYSKAIKKEPKNPTGYIRLGCAYDKLEKYEAAINEYNEVLKLPPMQILYGETYNMHVSAYSLRASSYKNLRNFDEAEADCYAALSIDPIHLPCLLTLGDIYSSRDNYNEAIKWYTKAIRLEPEDDIAYWLRGDLHKITGNYEKAIIDYKTVLKLNPKNKYMKDDIAECLELMALDDEVEEN
jgi:tetratricopeptide (TPR) repeat protein